MVYTFEAAIPVLTRTPAVLRALLDGLPSPWLSAREGPDTWSPFDVVGHLIHGERTDWIPRVEHILAHGESVPFVPFDRFAQLEASRGKTLAELLDTFATLRAANLERLADFRLSAEDLSIRGRHPALGAVTLGQHLASWVVHDLDHIAQISRVMGKQYTAAVGPWRQYLRIVKAD